MNHSELRRPIEALLFVAGEALSIPKLAALCDAEESEIAAALQQIEAEYSDRGMVLREVAGGRKVACHYDFLEHQPAAQPQVAVAVS